jgi:SAM-dependent methyltransferase
VVSDSALRDDRRRWYGRDVLEPARPQPLPQRRCPVCGSDETRPFARGWDVEYRTTAQIFVYLQCTHCDAVFLFDPPVDRLAQIYPPTYYSFAGWNDSLVQRIKKWLDARLFRQLVQALPGARLTVLDVGGGNGWLLSLVREQDARVAETHEVDLDAAARASAEAAGHVFHCQRIEDFSSPQQFDLVIMLNIIEHVADPGLVLRRVAGLLSPHGVALIKTPNTDTLDRRLFQRHNWNGLHCPRHWVLFTAPGFLRLARQSGLESVWLRYTQGAPQWAGSVLGWLADRGWVSITAERPMHRHPLHAPLLGLAAAVDFARGPFMKTAQMFVLLRRSTHP